MSVIVVGGTVIHVGGILVGEEPEVGSLFDEMMADNPVMYIRDSTGADVSGNDLDLTPFGSPINGASLDTSDPSGNSITLDGSNNLWNSEHYEELDLSEALSLSFRFNATNVGSGINRELARKTFFYGTFIGSDGKLHGICRATTDYEIIGVTAIESDTTYHCGLSFDGITLRLYLNGVEEDSIEVLQDLSVNNSQPFTIGTSGIGGSFAGLIGTIDEIGVFDTALSPTRMMAHYQAGS